jgi:hypothetical protein
VSEISEADFAASFRPPPAGSAPEVLARRLATPDLDELAEAVAAKAAADARAEQREQLLAANRSSGDPIGMVSRCQAQLAEERDRVRECEARLEEARGRLSRAAGNLEHWTAAAEEVRTAVAQRSDTNDLIGPAKAMLAGHQEFVSATRAAVAALGSGAPRQRRPFGGVARRSEVTCHECIKAGASPEESFLLHADPDAATESEMVGLSEMTVAAWGRQDQAERHGRYAEVSR